MSLHLGKKVSVILAIAILVVVAAFRLQGAGLVQEKRASQTREMIANVLLDRVKAALLEYAQEIERVSVDSSGNQGNGDSGWATWRASAAPSLSAHGRYVAFMSLASNLVPGDTNGEWVCDVFVHDRQTHQTTRVSLDSSGNEGNMKSEYPSISADGRYVAFRSYARNLVPGDTNRRPDIFVHDRQTGETTRVSVDSSGNEGNDSSHWPSISADGRYVTFYSDASNLVPGDANGTQDIFVHDRQTGQTTRVSLDSSGNEGNGESDFPSISADGRYVAFRSSADNLVPGDTNGVWDIFVSWGFLPSAIPILETYPNEAAPGGNWYQWQGYEFSLEESSDIYIQLTGQAWSGSQNPSGGDDDLIVNLDGQWLNSWNAPDSIDGWSQWGRKRTINLTKTGLSPGKHILRLWADEKPVLYSLIVSTQPLPVELSTYPNEQAAGGNWYYWQGYEFTLEQSADLYIQLTAQAWSGPQNPSGGDDDLIVNLDGQWLNSWNAPDSIDGWSQWGRKRTINLTKTGLSAGKHILILWADETPVVYSIKVIAE